jgi:DNA-binding MarR family transcriptional regulator
MDAPERLKTKPSWLLSQAALAGDRLVSEALAAEGVRKYHFRVLVALADDGPLSQAEIGRRLGIDRSDMAAVAADLEARGHLTRQRDAADRRRNVVALTPAGADALKRMDAAVEHAQAQLLAPLDDSERDALTRLLARLVL